MTRTAIGLAAAAGLCTAAHADVTVTFEFLPEPAMSVNDMSPDGRYFVGETDQNGDNFPDGTYLWDRVTSAMLILPPAGLSAVGVSDDGSVVVGEMPNPVPGQGEVAARWTKDTGWVSLGYLDGALDCPSRSNGYEVSADGSTVVGLSWIGCSGRGVVWTEPTGMLELEALANGSNRASVVSSDGSMIAGFAQGTFSRTPAIWNASTLAGTLVDPTGDMQGEITGMRDDGSVFLGTAYLGGSDGSYDAMMWSVGGQVLKIGNGSLLAGWGGIAMDIADDNTIVGFDILLGNRRAWILPQNTGNLQLLSTWATDHGAIVPVTLEVPQAISRDGRFICGHGFGSGAWLMTVTSDACEADLSGSSDPNDPGYGTPDGAIDSSDFFYFLDQFVGGNVAVADLSGSTDPNDPGYGVPDGLLDASDFFYFLDVFVQGCD